MSKTKQRIFRPLIILLDFIIQKDKNLWVFTVCHKRKVLYDNPRFLFEVAKKNPNLKIKVLSYDLKAINHSGYEKYIISIFSFTAILTLLRAGNIFIRHSLQDFYWMGISNRGRKIINLWHGIPLKKIRFLAKTLSLKRNQKESKNTSAIIASSTIDQLAMSAAHQIPPDDVWITGLPRNDIFSSSYVPSADLKKEEEKLKKLLDGKKLILYAPTFREKEAGSYPFTTQDLMNLKKLGEKGYVFGTRLHVRDRAANFPPEYVLDLGQNVISETQIVLKYTDILITDYSSIWVDYLLLNRPILGLCHDFDKYMNQDRGFIYHYDQIFPGQICAGFEEVYKVLEEITSGKESSSDMEKRQHAIEMFHEYPNDGLCSQRVYDRIIRE